jgi:hypothetical protein
MAQTHPKSECAPTGESKTIVVFMVRRETKCAECGRELFDGDVLLLEENRRLCLNCADLEYLEFLRSGNTALTRRATEHSPLCAVVCNGRALANAMNAKASLLRRRRLIGRKRNVWPMKNNAFPSGSAPPSDARSKTLNTNQPSPTSSIRNCLRVVRHKRLCKSLRGRAGNIPGAWAVRRRRRSLIRKRCDWPSSNKRATTNSYGDGGPSTRPRISAQ